MEPGHIALIILGAISCCEATLGITAPARIQAAVRSILDESPERNVFTSVFFAGLAVVLMLLMTAGQRPSDWALLVLSWLFLGGAYANFRRGAFRALAHVLILDRSPFTLRCMYLLELGVALGLIAIALKRW